MPGHQAYLDFAVEVGAELPARARETAARARPGSQMRRDDLSRSLPPPPRCRVSGRGRGQTAATAALAAARSKWVGS